MPHVTSVPSQVLQGNSTRPPPRDSILIGDLVDPAEWLGALRKCDAAVLPCLKVGSRGPVAMGQGFRVTLPGVTLTQGGSHQLVVPSGRDTIG